MKASEVLRLAKTRMFTPEEVLDGVSSDPLRTTEYLCFAIEELYKNDEIPHEDMQRLRRSIGGRLFPFSSYAAHLFTVDTGFRAQYGAKQWREREKAIQRRKFQWIDDMVEEFETRGD